MRAPGMTMFRMPIFTWNILVTSILVLVAFPVVAGKNYFVESRDTLGPAGAWTALPAGPHNSGTVSETSSASQRWLTSAGMPRARCPVVSGRCSRWPWR